MAAFVFPSRPHERRHGPRGYQHYESYKPWLRDEFHYRCAYCLTRETWYVNGVDSFSVDHFTPQSLALPGVEQYDNLFYACIRCNTAKGVSRGVLNPCDIALGDHLRYTEDGNIDALTPEGQLHIRDLRLDSGVAVSFRERLIATLSAIRDTAVLTAWLGLPKDAVDLRRLRPPGGNTRPDGIRALMPGTP